MDRDELIEQLVKAMAGWTPALRAMLTDINPGARVRARYIAAGLLADQLTGARASSQDQLQLG